MSQLKEGKKVNLLFLHLFVLFWPQWIGSCPPTLGRVTCFIQPKDSNAHLFQKYPQTHPEITFSQLSGHLLAGHVNT